MLENFKRLHPFYCGTPVFRALSEARANFHADRPVDPEIAIDEIIAITLADWKLLGHFFFMDGDEKDLYGPAILVEGDDIGGYLPWDFEGFNPVQGERYELKLRRFRYGKFKEYEVLGVKKLAV